MTNDEDKKEIARIRRNEAQRARRASPEAKAKEAAASRASKARKNSAGGQGVSLPVEATTEPPKAPETSATHAAELESGMISSKDQKADGLISSSPTSRYSRPGRRGDVRRPVRVLQSSRWNRQLWQGLRADAAAMTPDERARIGMPSLLPEPDRTPGRHGAFLTPRARRQLTSDLKRARMESQAREALRQAAAEPSH